MKHPWIGRIELTGAPAPNELAATHSQQAQCLLVEQRRGLLTGQDRKGDLQGFEECRQPTGGFGDSEAIDRRIGGGVDLDQPTLTVGVAIGSQPRARIASSMAGMARSS